MPSIAIGSKRIAYRSTRASRTRAGGRPSLICIHGAGGHAMNWPPQLRHHRNWETYAVDLPGHGASTGSGAQTIGAYREDVAAFARAMQLARVVAVGHSMGGAIALDWALAEPERVAGLILLGTGARLPVAASLLTGLAERYAETIEALVDQLVDVNADPRLREALRTQLLRADAQVVLGDFQACNAFDVSDRLDALGLPTLILCGAADRMTPLRMSQRLQVKLPRSTMTPIPQAGHMVMLEQPTQVVEAMAQFMAAHWQ